MIKSLYNLSNESGIIALDNTKNKRVLLIRSSDALGSLSRIIRSVKSRNKRWRLLKKDYKKVDIKLLSSDGTRLSYQYWVSHYEGLGYTFYSSYKAIQYKVKVDVIAEDKYMSHMQEVAVKLVTRNGTEVLVGLFDTIEQANEFVRQVYPNEVVNTVSYCMNDKTKKYYKK